MRRRREEPEWWAEARSMREAGDKIIVIAVTFGVTDKAVRHALDPEPDRRRSKDWARNNRPRIRRYYNAWRLTKLTERMEKALAALPIVLRIRMDQMKATDSPRGMDRRTLRALERRGLAKSRIAGRQGRVLIEVWELREAH